MKKGKKNWLLSHVLDVLQDGEMTTNEILSKIRDKPYAWTQTHTSLATYLRTSKEFQQVSRVKIPTGLYGTRTISVWRRA